MISRYQQVKGFLFRDYSLTRRYLYWNIVFIFYAFVSSATIALIGVASHDYRLTITLVLGALLWNFLSVLFNEISMSVAYERWEGTIEYTFMAPVSRFIHLFSVSLFAFLNSMVRTIIVAFGLCFFVHISLSGANLVGIFIVLIASSFAFMGLGLMAAALPLLSAEKGAEGTHIIQGLLLLISGVYYPVSVLPAWVRPLSYLSPATYALKACRKLMGVDGPINSAVLTGAPLSAIVPELAMLILMGILFIPLGLWIFGSVENWAKRRGKLKRTG